MSAERRPLGQLLADRIAGPEPSAALASPVEWIEAELGDSLWSKQREIAESVAAHRFTAVPSANGCGKSFTAARLAAWWIASKPIGEAVVVMSAPTSRQIDAVLWAELRRAHARGRLPGTLTRGEWRIGGTLVALARKSTDFIDAERAAAAWQGIHRAYVLVVLDEASGVPDWLWRALPGLTTGASSRTLAIGNPLSPSGRFAQVCAPGSGWNVIAVSALETPAFTGETVPASVREALPSPEWVAEMARDYGEGSPAYRARVLGRFPEMSDDGLISAEWVREAQERELAAEGPATFGVDVARAGSDSTVIARRQGGRVRIVHAARGHDLMRTTGTVARLLRAEPDSHAVVDATGLGSGVVDRLREQDLPVVEFNGAERASRPDRFANARAETGWALREALRAGGLDLAEDDDAFAVQLLAPQWTTNSRGLIQLESKGDMVKRGVSSPDRFDAAALTFAERRRQPIVIASGPIDPEARAIAEPEVPNYGRGLTGDLLGRKM